MSDCAKNSVLLKNKRHIILPNMIDTSTFRPFDKKNQKSCGIFQITRKLFYLAH